MDQRGARARLRALPFRNEVALLVALLLGTWFLRFAGKPVAVGIYGVGLVSGASLAMQAIGVVLVYRSNRIINFAQFAFGATAASIFAVLVHASPLLRMTRSLCPPCLPRVTRTELDVNYWVSLVLALGLSLLLSFLVYRLVVRRFETAPRLVLTVATIFVAQGLPALSGGFTLLASTSAQRQSLGGLTGVVRPPYDVSFTIRQGGVPVVFHLVDVLTVLAAVIAAVAVSRYMRRSSTGRAIRAASENPARAATLGVDVGRVTSRVWVLVGLLSGVASILQVSTGGTSATVDSITLVEILLVAVLARMTSLPLTAAAAVTIGVVQASMQWSFGSPAAFEGSLFVLVGAALLLQRYQVSRADLEQAGSWQSSREARPIPAELRSLPSVRKWRMSGGIVLAAVLVGYPWVMSPGQVQLGTLAMLYGMVGLSLLILTGWSGQISLGQLGLAAVGGYAAAVTRLPFPAALLVGALAGALAATAVGLPALRLRGLHLAVTSLAFALGVSAVLLDPDYLGSYLPQEIPEASLFGLHVSDGAGFYFLTLALLALVTVMVVGLRRTRTGRALVAARDNERGAQSFGIGLMQLRLMGFAISGAVAGLAGVLLAYQSHNVSQQNFAPSLSLSVFLFMVIGGTGAVCGPLLGAAYAWIAFIGGVTPILSELLTGFGGLALLLFFPGGLAKVYLDLRDAGLRRIASRLRIVVPSLMADRDLHRAPDRAAIAPKQAKRGGTVFVPSRYALSDQWITRVRKGLLAPGGTSTPAVEVPAAEGFHGLTDADVKESAGV